MDVHVKQEKFDAEFEHGADRLASQWEIYGSWVDTSTSKNKEHLSSSKELLIPIGERSKLLSTGSYECEYEDATNRAKREFVPDERKDTSYWAKRFKNNASARRSRLKKKMMEKSMENQLQQLQRENIELKYELAALKRHFAGQMDSQYPCDVVRSNSRSDLSMRAGSATDSSDSSSVTSEGDNYHGAYDTDSVAASPLSSLATSTTNRHLEPTVFPYQDGWSVPFNYSFMPYSVSDRGQRDHSSADNEMETLTKIPHKFRHKKDYHSAFFAHQYSDDHPSDQHP